MTLLYSASCLLSQSYSYIMAVFGLRSPEIFWKIKLDQTDGIHKYNLKYERISIKVYQAIATAVYTKSPLFFRTTAGPQFSQHTRIASSNNDYFGLINDGFCALGLRNGKEYGKKLTWLHLRLTSLEVSNTFAGEL